MRCDDGADDGEPLGQGLFVGPPVGQQRYGRVGVGGMKIKG